MKWNWGTGITAAIILFMGGTLGFVYFSTTLEYQMVSDNHYERGVKYQQQIDRQQRAKALEHSLEIDLNREQQAMNIQYPDTFDSASLKGEIHLYRPDNARLDQRIDVQADENGRQQISTAALARGKWNIKVTWISNNLEYFTEQTIFIN